MSETKPASTNIDNDVVEKVKDFISQYNKIAELCFTDCVSDFTARDLKASENKCALNCVEKFLQVSSRTSERFQEFHMLNNENAIAAAQKQSQKTGSS